MRSLAAVAIVLGYRLLLAALPAQGQHLQVFDTEDFVDPSLLGLLSEGQEAKAFAALSLTAGEGRDLQRWGEFAQGESRFTHLTGDLYYGDWQVGLDVLNLGVHEGSTLFGDRMGFEIGRYLTSESPSLVQRPELGKQEVVRYVTRVLLAWQVERQRGGGTGHSLTLDADVRRDGPRTSIADPVGGYSYTWVQAGAGDKGHDRHYLSLDYRSPIAAYKKGLRVNLGFGIGAEHTLGHFRWGAARLELAGDIPIRPLRSKLRLSWAPAYQLDRGGFHHEVAILFLPPLVSRIFSPPWQPSAARGADRAAKRVAIENRQ